MPDGPEWIFWAWTEYGCCFTLSSESHTKFLMAQANLKLCREGNSQNFLDCWTATVQVYHQGRWQNCTKSKGQGCLDNVLCYLCKKSRCGSLWASYPRTWKINDLIFCTSTSRTYSQHTAMEYQNTHPYLKGEIRKHSKCQCLAILKS